MLDTHHETEQPAAQVAIDQLHEGVKTPEEEVILTQWQEELDAQRAEALKDIGTVALPHLVRLPDGSIVDKATLDGDTPSPYKKNRRG